MNLFKKKCQYCGTKIEKGKEIFTEVKIPEFKNKKIKPFCSEEHARLYKEYSKNIKKIGFCPNCMR